MLIKVKEKVGIPGGFSKVTENSTAKVSAEAVEVEANRNRVAFGGNDPDGDEIGGEGAGEELQVEGSTNRTAGAGTPATGNCAAS